MNGLGLHRPTSDPRNGVTSEHYVAAAAANQDSHTFKSAPGVVHHLHVSGPAAAAVYVKLYNKASNPTSADTPVYTMYMPAGSGNNPNFPSPIAMSAGIAIRITTGIADNDANAVSSGDCIVNIGYL